jgi:hypothetical protein
MAGANMSGDLKNPRRSIPLGTLAAIGVSLVVYLLLGYWIARSATPGELTANYTVMIDKAYWGPPVLAGLLGATFSSALASLVGSARILQAMGDHGVVPFGGWLAERTPVGEPRNAMLVTGAVLFGTLLLRDLNAVAPLVTMFFLVTYAMLNAVLLIEQSLDLVSFRPLFRVPRAVPLLGLVGSLFAMFIIQPTVGWISLAIVVAVYVLLLRRELDAPFADMRSGLFVSMAEWAAMKVQELPPKQERAWKPNLLVPVEDPQQIRGAFDLLASLARPKGTLKLFGLRRGDADGGLDARLEDMAHGFREAGVFTGWTAVEAAAFGDGVVAAMQSLRGAFFRPNILFLGLPDAGPREGEIRRVIGKAEELGVGTLLHAPHPAAGLGRRRWLNVWIRDRSPDWRISWDVGNLDLSILAAYKLARNWDARLRLVMVVEDPGEQDAARHFLEDLTSLARIPDADLVVGAGDFGRWVGRAPQADVSVFGLVRDPDFALMRALVEETGSTCLFVRDSGQESVLA